jgi:hypothetical protein
MLMKNKGVSENEASVARPASPLLPRKKATLSIQITDVLQKSAGILLKPWVFLSLLERWGTNPSLQNVETREVGCPTCWLRPIAQGPHPPGTTNLAIHQTTWQPHVFSDIPYKLSARGNPRGFGIRKPGHSI